MKVLVVDGNPQAIKILKMMLTGHTEVESVKAAKDFGVNAYIGKPYSPQQIREKREALAKTL